MKSAIKKIISLLTVFSCLSCSIVYSGAVSENVTQDRDRIVYRNAEAFLDGVVKQGNIEETIYLYDLSEEIVAVYCSLQPYGYIIIDYKDGHVIEYSSDFQPLSDSGEHYYYMGPQEIYKKVLTGYQNVISNDIIEFSSFVPVKLSYASDMTGAITDYSMTYASTANSPSYIGTPKPPFICSNTSNKYCVITAISNALQWLKDYRGRNVYADGVTSIHELCSYLHDNRYVCGLCGLTWVQATSYHRHEDELYSGLSTYLKRSDVGTVNFQIAASSPQNVKTQIRNQRPVLIILPTSLIISEKGDHAVFIYGYQETANTTYYILNDSYGNNNVYVCCDDVPVTSEGIMYLW